MKTLKSFFLIFFVLFGLNNTAFADLDKIDIQILPEAIVYNDSYQLGDIAEIDGFDIDKVQQLATITVGRSPLPGRSSKLSRSIIISKISAHIHRDLFNLNFPKKSTIARAAIKIKQDQLAEIVTTEISKLYEDYDQVNITIKSNLKDIYIPKGKASYSIKRIGTTARVGGLSSWMLKLEVGGKLYKKLLIRANVAVIDQVTVVGSNIRKGEKVQEKHLSTVNMDISNKTRGYVSADRKDLIGKKARRDIFEKESMEKRLVVRPLVMQKGQPISLIYQTDTLYFTNLAVALKNGKLGEVIPVKILSNKKTIYARILNAKQAEVAL